MARSLEDYASMFADLPPNVPVLLLGPPGIGKCLGPGTPILMSDGRVLPVESIVSGDRVMGPDGKARTVLATTQGRDEMFRIDPIKGEPWTCNSVHVLTLVHSTNDKVTDIGLDKWMESSDNFRHQHKQFSVGVDKFENEMEPPLIDPYFLGVWFGDGPHSINTLADGREVVTKVCVTKPDQAIRDICRETAKQWETGVREGTNSCGCSTLALTTERGQDNRLLRTLRDVVGPMVDVPDSILRGSRETRLQFLAGFLDTDGELSSNCFVITQRRGRWARAVWFIARSLGLCATITTRKVIGYEDDYHVVTISGHTDVVPTQITRKQAAPRQQRKDATRTGFKVTPLGEGDYYGFMLDGDGRFLLGDFTVTHNSALAKLTARTIEDRQPIDAELGCRQPVQTIILDLACHLPEDINGVPTFLDVAGGGRVTIYAPPLKLYEGSEDYLEDRPCVIVFDDISNAQMSVQTATYRAMAEHETGSVKLGKNARIIATGNRREDKSGATVLPSALRNRLLIFEVEPDLMNWTRWWKHQDLPFEIPAFLRWKPEHFSRLPDTADSKGAFATPRSWEKVGRTLDVAMRHGMVREVAAAAVGEGVSIEFKAFIDVRKELPDPEEILANPQKAVPRVPRDRPDILIAMMTMLASHAGKIKGQSKRAQTIHGEFVEAIAYISQHNKEYCGVAVDAYWSAGGAIPKMAQYIRSPEGQKNPLVKNLLQHIQCAVDI